MGLLAFMSRCMPMQREQKGNRGSTIASLAKGNSTPCQDSDGGEYAGPDLPEEIWDRVCSLLPMRDAARAACVSRAFLSSWRHHPDLAFTRETMCSNEILLKWTADLKDERRRAERYNRNIDRVLANHRGAGAKTFMLHFHGPDNTKYYSRLDAWLQTAITPALEGLALYMLSGSGRPTYSFPCSLLSDGSGNTVRRLCLAHCVLRPTANLSLRCLTKLHLHSVCVADDELGRILSGSSALVSLVLKHCDDLTRLQIPCWLQRLSYVEVFECSGLGAIENKAPNIYLFVFTGDEIQLSLGESLRAKCVTLRRGCAIHYAMDKLASSAPNLETLNLRSSHEMFHAPIHHVLPSKFLHLKVLTIRIQYWNFGQEYDFLSLVSFLHASPSLETFWLSVSVQSKYDLIAGDPSTLRQMPECHHDKLKIVRITGFCRQKSLVELTRHILESATSLKSLTLNTIDPRYQFNGHNRFRKCPTLDKEYIREVRESIMAVKTYIEGKIPSTVNLKVIGPCSQCHAF